MMRDRYQRTAENGGIAPGAVRHNANTYRNWGCRCEACRKDNSRQRAKKVRHRKPVAERMADLRRRRYAKTRANGGVAPAANHNHVTYSTWGCRCEWCVSAYRAEKARLRRRRVAGRPRRPDITISDVVRHHEKGMSERQIARLLGCSRDAVHARILAAATK